MLDRLHQSGSLKGLFPRHGAAGLETVLLNTAGGVTGGDSFSVTAQAETGTALTITTQACERAYKAQPGQTGQIRTELTVSGGARMNWLPQETILFNDSALDRRLTADLAPDASLLLVEPLIFGRPAMGETVNSLRLKDRVEINRDARPLFRDATRFAGDLHTHLGRRHVADGAGAMALILLVDAAAEAHLQPLRDLLPDTAGASLLHTDVLVARVLAKDGFHLRQTLLPLMGRLNGASLPRCWMI